MNKAMAQNNKTVNAAITIHYEVSGKINGGNHAIKTANTNWCIVRANLEIKIFSARGFFTA